MNRLLQRVRVCSAIISTVTVLSLVAPLSVGAQAAGKPRIGYLGSPSAAQDAPWLEAFRQGLRELGYVEGVNILIEPRWADGNYDRLPSLAAELVRLKVDVLVTYGTPGTRAAKQATSTIPIVMAVSGDAVATGLVTSIARPGGNLTGATFFNPELGAKRIELLKEAVPRMTRVAVLMNQDNPVNGPVLQAMESRVRSLKVELVQFQTRGPEGFDKAFAEMAQKQVQALALIEDAVLIVNARRIAELALRNRLPATGFKEFAEAGGLMAYAVNVREMFRQAPVFVDKILKGAKPGDLPVEQSTKFEMLINLKTAKILGLTIPRSLLLRADQVRE